MDLRKYLSGVYERVRDWFLGTSLEYPLIAYANALHRGGVDGKPAQRVRTLVGEQFPEDEARITLRRCSTLDSLFRKAKDLAD
jgi:hypothetical protein